MAYRDIIKEQTNYYIGFFVFFNREYYILHKL